MYVVRHQHIGMQAYSLVFQDLGKPLAVEREIFIVEKRRRAVHPAMGDVERRTRCFEARATRHDAQDSLDFAHRAQPLRR